MTDHAISPEALIAFALGETDAGQSARIQAHVAGCEDCAATVARVAAMRDAMRAYEGHGAPDRVIKRAQAIFQPLSGVRVPTHVHSTRPMLGGFVRRALVAAVALCLLAVGGFSVFTAYAADALPGETLYSVKLAGEALQSALLLDPVDQITRHLELADLRDRELVNLAARGQNDELAQTGQAGQAQMDQALAKLSRLAADDPARASALAPRVEQALETRTAVLIGVLGNAPAAARPGLETAINAVQHSQAVLQTIVVPRKGGTDTAPGNAGSLTPPAALRTPQAGGQSPARPSVDSTPAAPNGGVAAPTHLPTGPVRAPATPAKSPNR